jgi:hypothetical protein
VGAEAPLVLFPALDKDTNPVRMQHKPVSLGASKADQIPQTKVVMQRHPSWTTITSRLAGTVKIGQI